MNKLEQQDSQSVEIRGRKYRYDSDFDAYYRIYESELSETHIARWAWLYLCVIVLVATVVSL